MMRPETNVKKKVLALERRKAQLDGLIAFLKSHPRIAAEGVLFAFPGRIGLKFGDYALIRPLLEDGEPVLRLEKFSEDWYELHPDEDPLDFTSRTVAEDVSKLSDKKVSALLEKIHRELAPEDFEDED